jgi:hypothetical protein
LDPVGRSTCSLKWPFPKDAWILVVLMSAWPTAFMMAKELAPAMAI